MYMPSFYIFLTFSGFIIWTSQHMIPISSPFLSLLSPGRTGTGENFLESSQSKRKSRAISSASITLYVIYVINKVLLFSMPLSHSNGPGQGRVFVFHFPLPPALYMLFLSLSPHLFLSISSSLIYFYIPFPPPKGSHTPYHTSFMLGDLALPLHPHLLPVLFLPACTPATTTTTCLHTTTHCIPPPALTCFPSHIFYHLDIPVSCLSLSDLLSPSVPRRGIS